MNVAIIEDETLAAERLRQMLVEIDGTIMVEAILPSLAEATAWLQNHTVDILFLDIQLSDGHSFELFKRVDVRAPIVFTTAYDQYAIEAFRHNSIAYLLKPVKKEELQRSLEKLRRMRESLLPDFAGLLADLLIAKASYKQRFLIQINQTIRHVQTSDIAYFYAISKGVYLVTTTKSTFPVDFTLDGLRDVLDPTKFFRINRKLLISYGAITGMHAFSRSRIKVDLAPPPPRDIEALVSAERAAEFRRWIDT